VTLIINSDSHINFGISPFLYKNLNEDLKSYIKINKLNNNESELEDEFLNMEVDLDLEMRVDKNVNLEEDFSDVLNLIYEPVLIINEGTLKFCNLEKKENFVICEYKLNKKDIIKPEFLNLIWTNNNTILLSSTKILFNMIKFSGDLELMGVPISKDIYLEVMEKIKK